MSRSTNFQRLHRILLNLPEFYGPWEVEGHHFTIYDIPLPLVVLNTKIVQDWIVSSRGKAENAQLSTQWMRMDKKESIR